MTTKVAFNICGTLVFEGNDIATMNVFERLIQSVRGLEDWARDRDMLLDDARLSLEVE